MSPLTLLESRRSAAASALVLIAVLPVMAQIPTPRVITQDPAINNLVEPAGYQAGEPSALGAVVRRGPASGPPLILVPGFGFGASAYDGLVAMLAKDYRVFALTLQGFGRTPAPRAPLESVSFGEQTWTLAAVSAIEKLIRDEGLDKPTVVGHWIGGTQIALRLAMRNPDRIRAVVVIAGSARMMVASPKFEEFYGTTERRVRTIDTFMAPRWFKTVTRETWDDNNFLPQDYSANPVLGLRLWRMAAEPPLHVWVRYLCEFNAQDISRDLGKLSTPTLLLQPSAADLPDSIDTDYLQGFLHRSWEGRIEGVSAIRTRVIPKSRVFAWVDQPNLVEEALNEFLSQTRTSATPYVAR